MGQHSQSDRVKLSVGGKKFESSRQTLCLHSESKLAEEEVQHLDPEVDLVIDRDGGRFDFVLNYLRNGTLFLEDIPSLYGVREEAEYYRLANLKNICEEKIAALGNERAAVASSRDEEQEIQRQIVAQLRSVTNLLQITKSAMTGIPLRTLQREEPVFDLNADF